jgi:multiple sugar transport system permease protein
MVLVLLFFYLYPIVSVFNLSLTDAQVGSNTRNYTLESYRRILSDRDLLHVLKVTLFFITGSVILQLSLGLLVGLLLNYDLPGAILLKIAMISAWVVPGIVTGILWQILYASTSWGLINNMLASAGLPKIPFLYHPTWAIVAATIANVWRGTGFSGLMQYAALRNIPQELYESASIDGAGGFQQFRFITLPQLRPMLMINLVLITIGSLNTYDSIWALTEGGPGIATTVLALQTYKATFQFLSLARGSVYAVMLVILSFGFTGIYLRLLGQRD